MPVPSEVVSISAPNAEQQALTLARADLAAQQEMAGWTQVMGLTGVAALILSAVGVFLVYRTLRESQKAAESARATVKSFKDAERGSIDIEIRNGQRSKTSNLVHYSVEVTNTGRSPVKITGIAAKALSEPEWAGHIQITNFLEMKIPADHEAKVIARAFDGPQNLRQPYMGGYVRYRDRFGDEHRSHFCVEVNEVPNDPDAQPWERANEFRVSTVLMERRWPQDT